MDSNTFVAFFFWYLIVVVFLKAINLCSEHPRSVTHNVGTDALSMIISIILLAWASFIKYGA